MNKLKNETNEKHIAIWQMIKLNNNCLINLYMSTVRKIYIHPTISFLKIKYIPLQFSSEYLIYNRLIPSFISLHTS